MASIIVSISIACVVICICQANRVYKKIQAKMSFGAGAKKGSKYGSKGRNNITDSQAMGSEEEEENENEDEDRAFRSKQK